MGDPLLLENARVSETGPVILRPKELIELIYRREGPQGFMRMLTELKILEPIRSGGWGSPAAHADFRAPDLVERMHP